MEWFEYPYPRPDLMNTWSLARHSEVMGENFETEASKTKFDNEVWSLSKSFKSGQAHVELSSLFECLYAAVKMEERKDPACQNRMSFTNLYSDGLLNFMKNYIHNPPCWKKAPNENDIVLYCMALTADLAKCVLKSLQITKDLLKFDTKRLKNVIAIVHALILTIDKDCLFHKLNKHRPLPPWILFHPRQYTKALAVEPQLMTTSVYQDWSLGHPHNKRHTSCDQQDEHSWWACGCGRCSTSPQEDYLWINILLEHFGCGSGSSGFDVFLDVLVKIALLETIRLDILKLCECILGYLSMGMEFLKDEKQAELLQPCLRVQGAISRWHQSNQLVDENFVGPVMLIANHLRCMFGLFLPSSVARAVMETTNELLRDLLISFQSNENTTIASWHSSPKAITRGAMTEQHHVVGTIDPTIVREMKDGVCGQIPQQLTKVVLELLAILIPTLQPEPMLKIMQQSEADGGGGQVIDYEPSYLNSPSIVTTKVSVDKMAESSSQLSPPRSSAALGATMRKDNELVSEFQILGRSPSLECSPVEELGNHDNFVPSL